MSFLSGVSVVQVAHASACDPLSSYWANRDDDGDGVCNGADICPFEYNPPTAGVQDPKACAPRVITVPGSSTTPNVPHVTYSGATITLKGIARYLTGGEQYQWDFGDGVTPSAWTSISNPWNLSMQHVYAGAAGQPFLATLSLRNSAGQVISTANYLVQVKQSADLTDPAQLDVRAQMAEDQALWYLHTQATRGWYGAVGASDRYSYWEGGNPLSTCLALDALAVHGSHPDGAYSTDPYVEDVQAGWNWVLQNASVYAISDRFGLGNPDTNGNGIGIAVGGDNVGRNGACLTALADARAPSRINHMGGTNVVGRTYQAIGQDMADWLAYAQVGGAWSRGGWSYSSTYSNFAEMDTTYRAILGLAAARDKLSATMSPGVQNYTHNFVDYAQASDGSWGWNAPNNMDNVGYTADGLIAQTFIGRSVSDDHFQRGLGFVYTHWGGTDNSWGATLGWAGAMYRVMTALTLPNPPLTRVSMYGGSGSFDWYYTPPGQTQVGYGTYLVSHQSFDGHWSDTTGVSGLEADDGAGGGEVMMTALDTMILLRNGQAPQPAAIVPPTPPTPPGPPQHLVATPGDGQVTLTWDPPASGSTPFTYTVASTPASGAIAINGTTATATGLTNGTSYTFVVTVTNPYGQAMATSAPVIPQASGPTCPATGCVTPPPSAATPELDTVALFAMGLLGLAGYARTRYSARRRGHSPRD